MNEEKKAFGMNFKEFSKFYDDIIGFEDEFNKNHKIAENGESLVDFICDGSDDLLQEDSDIMPNLI